MGHPYSVEIEDEPRKRRVFFRGHPSMWARWHEPKRKSTSTAASPRKRARPTVSAPLIPPNPPLPYRVVSPPNGLRQCEHALGACGHLRQKYERARVGVGGPKSKMSSLHHNVDMIEIRHTKSPSSCRAAGPKNDQHLTFPLPFGRLMRWWNFIIRSPQAPSSRK